MRKTDSALTLKLEDHVLEMQGKTATKKGLTKKAAAPVDSKTVESNQQSPRHSITVENASPPEFGEGTSGLTPRESEREYYNQE